MQYMCLQSKQENNLNKKALTEEVTIGRFKDQFAFPICRKTSFNTEQLHYIFDIQYSFERSLILSFTVSFFLVHNDQLAKSLYMIQAKGNIWGSTLGIHYLVIR